MTSEEFDEIHTQVVTRFSNSQLGMTKERYVLALNSMPNNILEYITTGKHEGDDNYWALWYVEAALIVLGERILLGDNDE
jgi:hypothetical protein